MKTFIKFIKAVILFLQNFGRALVILFGVIELSIVLNAFKVSFHIGIITTVICIMFFYWMWSLFEEKGLSQKIIQTSILLITIGTLFTYSLAFVLDNLSENSAVWAVGSVSDWIPFFGSIIGGFTTMLAVYYTIQHNEKIGRQEFNRQIMPYIEITDLDGFSVTNQVPIVKVTNISEYPLINLEITSTSYLNGKEHPIVLKSEYTVNFLKSHGSIELFIAEFPIDISKLTKKDVYEISSSARFKDFMNSTKYFHDFDFTITKNSNIKNPKQKYKISPVHNSFNPEFPAVVPELFSNFKSKLLNFLKKK